MSESIAYPPRHLAQVLEAVQQKKNLLDIGSHATTFFDFYPEFSGELVQVELNPLLADASREKMNRLLPNMAATRARLLMTNDLFDIGESIGGKKFDLITVGHQAASSQESADQLFEYIKQRLLSEKGTVAVMGSLTQNIGFEKSYDDKENVGVSKDFSLFKEKLSEYTDLTSNPAFNAGVQVRHFAGITRIEEDIQQIMTFEKFVQFIQAQPAFKRYAADRSQIDKYALPTLHRKLNERIAKRTAQAISQPNLLRVTHKIITCLLKK